MARRPDPRRVKIHRSYRIAEVASLFQIHRNTVRRWAKQGLQVLDERKPYLILGRALASFLADRNSRRIRLKPGEMYCVKCKVARQPARNIADYVPIGVNVAARLEGLSEPGRICVSGAVYDHVRDKLDIAFEDEGEQQLKNIARPVRVYKAVIGHTTTRKPLALCRVDGLSHGRVLSLKSIRAILAFIKYAGTA
jgi:hypothetical protein